MADPIVPARLKKKATLESIDAWSASAPGGSPAGGAGHVVRGTALVFWDPKVAGKKLDAIDTDQITPAADCVSESLETLDERWKAGSFRHLMPDFRARVHAGATFVVAGARFAIGSSREMSPAGLKGVAEEAGKEMVVVCGENMGDIFRRNALNLGLHVVQSSEAVADAQDGDAFEFDTATRRLTNVTRGKSYDPVPISPKEKEIRRGDTISPALAQDDSSSSSWKITSTRRRMDRSRRACDSRARGAGRSGTQRCPTSP